jgi:hypothetical protein
MARSLVRRHFMATPETGDWRELFDVALFEPSRVKLRQRIEHAQDAINKRLDVLKNETGNEKTTSENIALRDALTTLAELRRIVYARRSSTSVSRQGGRAVS